MRKKAEISLLTVLLLTAPAFAFENKPLKFGFSDQAALEAGLPFRGEGQRLASVCFLGFGQCDTDAGFGTGGGEDFTLDTAEQCKNEGYTITSCDLPNYPSGQCPYNEGYYASCSADNEKACKEAGYVTSCDEGYVQDSSQSCPYDSSYKKCKCNPCEGYDYTYAEATETGYVTDGFCISCNTTKYKRKNNPCVGYYDCECGGEIGSGTCKSGSATKYAVCKTCCENKCTLASCPENHDCEYEECSGKYCDNGCSSGYTDMCTAYGEYGASTCTQMGYRQQTCTGDGLLCPYDTTYKFCM